jgi:uncharacterized protein
MCEQYMSLGAALESRRSVYGIGRNVTLSDDEIAGIISHCVKFCPSAYNSQSGRVALLLGDAHEKLWDTVRDFYESALPDEVYKQFEPKFKGFMAGYGTVLFFEEQDTIKDLQRRFPQVKDTFPLWSLQSSGMLQYSVWVSLEEKGLGASLQHYNPAIQKLGFKEWDIPKKWELVAQMPFGSVEKQPDPKTFLPLEDRVKVFK